MRPFFWIASLVGLVLTACETRQPVVTAHKQPIKPPHLETAAKPVVSKTGADSTIASVFGKIYYGQILLPAPDASQALPHLLLDKQLWRIRTAAQADSAHPLTFTEAADKENHLPATVEKGVDVQYAFQLLDQRGHARFTKRMRKADFASVVYGGLRTVAPASPPTYLGYWPARRALVFNVNFVRGETDEGLQTLLLLDVTAGQVLHLAAEEAYMGSCDCWPTLTPDRQTLLAGEELLVATGRVISLTKSGRAVAGTRILNDSTFLVVYESGDPSSDRLPSHNAQLIDRTGRVKRTFTFHGTDTGWASGGYSLEAAFVPATGTHYLFDGRTTTFTMIPAGRPGALQQLRAEQLVRFRPPQRASEKKLEFEYNDTPSAALYVDTLTQQLRYADTKVSYQ